MDQLFNTQNVWMHYIGGYYKTHKQFIREAQRSGITRRIPATVARGMNYGDRVILLRYAGKGSVFGFAEMVITGIVLTGDIADKVGQKLASDGRATYTPGGGMVQRECGSFMIMGTWHVNADMKEIMETASEIAEKEKLDLFVMISGKLTHVYDAPIYLQPAPAFTRGFIKCDEQATFSTCTSEWSPTSSRLRAIMRKIVVRNAQRYRDERNTQTNKRSH